MELTDTLDSGSTVELGMNKVSEALNVGNSEDGRSVETELGVSKVDERIVSVENAEEASIEDSTKLVITLDSITGGEDDETMSDGNTEVGKAELSREVLNRTSLENEVGRAELS